MSDTVFVAGASGVVGTPLCRLLVNDGWQVTGTTRSEQNARVLSDLGVEPRVVDVFDRRSLVQILGQVRPAVVVHQLTDLPDGLDPGRMAEAVVRNARIREAGTANLVEAAAAAGVRRLVAQSIAFAYGPGPTPYREDAPLDGDNPKLQVTVRGVVTLERQVLEGPFEGIVLRYGRFYGPGTGFDGPSAGGAVHVDAAADAARRAITRGAEGIYNIAEEDGTVSSEKARRALAWEADFRIAG